MESEVSDHIKVKFFIGFPVTSEVRMHLRNSEQWKQFQLLRSHLDDGILETTLKGKPFVGRFIETEGVSIRMLEKLSESMKEKLSAFTSKSCVESLTLTVFPQVFLL